ncbi:MAG: hypothetical protein HAW63_01360 [Bdellovibrionaceae bacterium]|nr:hypothetical protein [Pseudobdellovibrionaceae bacterium]
MLKETSSVAKTRLPLFSFFSEFQLPQLCLTFTVKAPKELLSLLNKKQINPSLFLMFYLAKTSLHIPQFRLREKAGTLMEVDSVTCSYLVQSPLTQINFCYIPYQNHLNNFLVEAKEQEDKAAKAEHIQTKQNIKSPLIEVVAMPRLNITSALSPVRNTKDISTPLFTLGKIAQQTHCTSFSLTIRTHHGLVDGLHSAQFIDSLQNNLTQWVSQNK